MQLKENIQIASFDLDDTLLHTGVLSKANREALIKLHNCGCKVVINTGRGLRFVPDSCKEDYVDYIIVSNGSRLYDNHQKKFIKNVFIDSKDVKHIFSLMKKEHAIKLMCDDATYTSLDMYPYYIYQFLRKKNTYQSSLTNLFSFLRNFIPCWNQQKKVDSNPEVFKMECSCRASVDPSQLVAKINAETNCTAVVVKGESVELTNSDAGKGKTLQYLADLLDVKKENIAAFGDSGNDTEALEVAGYAIAMGNAIEKVKKASNIIIGNAKDDGIAEYINSIIEE